MAYQLPVTHGMVKHRLIPWIWQRLEAPLYGFVALFILWNAKDHVDDLLRDLVFSAYWSHEAYFAGVTALSVFAIVMIYLVGLTIQRAVKR